MTENDWWKVVKEGDPYEGQIGVLLEITPTGGKLSFEDGERRDYERHEIRAVIKT